MVIRAIGRACRHAPGVRKQILTIGVTEMEDRKTKERVLMPVKGDLVTRWFVSGATLAFSRRERANNHPPARSRRKSRVPSKKTAGLLEVYFVPRGGVHCRGKFRRVYPAYLA